MQVALNGVKGAEISHVNITSTWYIDPKSKQLMEPHNTDGIDPGGGSSEIHIHDVSIHNGDDSVAVKPHGEGEDSGCTRNILVENCRFEKGHGCSIGSVGKGCVENVLFRNITMKSQENGCRVKTYSEGAGHVRAFFQASVAVECVVLLRVSERPSYVLLTCTGEQHHVGHHHNRRYR
jgi:polygalacturonase|eukprot:COSAG02_NODE_5249_length_4499_cov_25.018636_7_plen_178_part_00